MSVEIARKVLRIEAQAIQDLAGRLDESFKRAVRMILDCRGRVVVTGMGKSGIICQKIAATLTSTGTPAFFMHPAEAIHGDLGMVVKGDVVLAVSNSGETDELLRLLETIRRLGAGLISMTGKPGSTLAEQSDVSLDIQIAQEACPLGLVPTASTTAALAMGDALAVAVYSARGFSESDFARFHPGGRLGRRVLTVEHIMHAGAAVPRVTPATTVREAVAEMTAKKLGCTTVVDADGRLAGFFTDGDLRRLLQQEGRPLEEAIDRYMTRGPATIHRQELASRALAILEERRITAVPVVDEAGILEGIVHLHDLWRLELF
jgi:arabinose-5-phosphate isomerase